jgi:nucleotide-binding universal stress UspA family protein
MKTILVPLDGSTLAEQALPTARLLAPLLPAHLLLLHVISEADRFHLLLEGLEATGENGRPAGPEREDAILRNNAMQYLEDQARKLREYGCEVRCEVQFGFVPETIVATAERVGASLIAMGTHGYSGLRRWALGSVAAKVLQASGVPMLLVRGEQAPGAGSTLRRIMLPLDGSEFARKAVPLAASLASAAQAELIVFSVVAPPLLEAPDNLAKYGGLDAAVAQVRGRLHDELGAYAKQLQESGVVVSPIATTGLVADTIVDEAAHYGVDLIVMATHGATGLRRWTLGSTADKVLHATTTPLLLINDHP